MTGKHETGLHTGSQALRASLGWLFVLTCVACAGASSQQTSPKNTLLQGAPEGGASQAPSQPGTVPSGTVTLDPSDKLTTAPNGAALVTTDELNIRQGPGTKYEVIGVIPLGGEATVVSETARNGWYNVRFGAVTGWASSSYLVTPSTGGGASSPSRESAIERAKSGLGFSYWWGHGRWSASGVTEENKGVCGGGGCPNCTHAGWGGADCSGYVAKIWQVPASNSVLDTDSHPFSTADFWEEHSLWDIISRDDLQKGDALVYRSGGSGHIVLYESGDAWGSFWAYEAKGCQWPISRNLRTANGYKAIRRTGF